MKTYAYGFPRLGKNREYKKIIENFWKGQATQEEVESMLSRTQDNMLLTYSGCLDSFPVGEITGYDQLLDTAIMLGLYNPKSLSDYYDLCRGKNALEMTKWFNTNYHYLVPDFSFMDTSHFKYTRNKPREDFEKYNRGIPFLIGPFTFLKLSKGISKNDFGEYLFKIVEIYSQILEELESAHIHHIHIEEPAFVMELSPDEIDLIKKAYGIMGKVGCGINLITYYDSVDFLQDLYELPVQSIGLDFVNGKENLENIKKTGFPGDKMLIAGIVNGRNVWKTNIKAAVAVLEELSQYAKSIVASNGAPLYHLPLTLAGEELGEALTKRLSFAEEKIEEIRAIAGFFETKQIPQESFSQKLGEKGKMQSRVKELKESDFNKEMSIEARCKLQGKILNLPLFPTTTIGSYPQTEEIRKKRADFRARRITPEEYDAFIKLKITELIKFQEELGLDVLVHGEFERTDMVEFFAQKLDGIATTKKGWIISYGTRAYRPPIIFGDVTRPEKMTVNEIMFAQSLTTKPVKGMLTGAVTIIAWSFVRDDIPLRDVAYQIGLCLKDEIRDYEKGGIKIVQIDEAAFREKAPIKRKDWPEFFDWAVKSFRLTTNTDPGTQIHSHMCYSEFGEIVEQIERMDFDVISIEAARSKGDIIESFEKGNFRQQIGLGIWDIHSPAIPTLEDMEAIVKRALENIPKNKFWINPDCGLKTRDWPETKKALRNLVKLAAKLRQESF
ncbi:MAG: 5-methyltetrahydropteroyltriglutamate--homocysteine S-methyltransferase [Candidatus Omnitrophica bacterium]|nr:5-methyltetrahydropteroyltriglutamate--homocysteine S-methyltransferase [Candidatus Omnitrophota bacterium]